jgi:hypothetical protein
LFYFYLAEIAEIFFPVSLLKQYYCKIPAKIPLILFFERRSDQE